MIVPILILIVGGWGYWYMLSTKKMLTKRKMPKLLPTVQVLVIKKGSFQPVIKTFGEVISYQHSDLSAQISTTINKVLVQFGQKVQAGDVLIQLHDHNSKLSLSKAQTDVVDISMQIKINEAKLAKEQSMLALDTKMLEIQKKALLRQISLYKSKHGTEEAVDNAQKVYQQQLIVVQKHEHDITINQLEKLSLSKKLARAIIVKNEALLDQNRTNIKAPFSGVVSGVDASVGEYVQKGTKLLSLVNRHAFEVHVQVAPAIVGILKEQLYLQKNILAKASVLGKPISLKLTEVSSHIDANALAPKVVFSVQDGHDDLSLGQSVGLDIFLPIKNNVFGVPNVAIYRDQVIYRVDYGSLQAVPIIRLGETIVKQGLRYRLVYSDALQSGDKILVSRLANPISGMRVRAKMKNKNAKRYQKKVRSTTSSFSG